MQPDDRSAAAKTLRHAQRSRVGIGVLTATYDDVAVDDAYAIQLLNVRERLAGNGRTVRGHKIGLTSRAMQQMFGVDEPDYGHLFDDMFVSDGATVDHAAYLRPRVEPEVAFVLSGALEGPAVTVADVFRATAFVLPALEIIDTRYEAWTMQLADTIADNASSAGVVLGTRPMPVDAVDLKTMGAVMRFNGRVVETGACGAVLGHPAVAVAWLANALARYDVRLEPDHLVLSGSITRAVDVAPGDQVVAQFDGLSSVGVRFA